MKNVNVTAPGGDGNPGAGKKVGLASDRRSVHVATHARRQARRERAWGRGAEKPQEEAE